MSSTKRAERSKASKPEVSAAPEVSATAEVSAAPEASSSSTLSFPVVGLGASAGGLAAFEAFFSAMPDDSEPGMAFVLVQHLAPDHKSLLTELIRRYTRMRVFEVEDGMAVSPNCAYIIPPNRDMAFLHGCLHLLDPTAPRGHHLPIDFFFRSLAEDLHERAICIVLSGTGSDGTLGVRAVKGGGGMVMAQKPDTTTYDGMPQSAIATGMVDYVLSPEEMPERLLAYASHAYRRQPSSAKPIAGNLDEALQKIFILVRAQTGHDFSLYKRNTISRRMERRMALHQIKTTDEYVKFLRQSHAEIESLYRDFLIGVTRFFRDPEAFKALEARVIPKIIGAASSEAPIRVWIPGCSTGEEAYSIAILLTEQMDTKNRGITLQIFATDIDDQAIDVARSGVYPASIATDLTEERLNRFFTPEPGAGFRIKKSIRDMLIFSTQNAGRDPPFSRLDLISCRNLLIYLDSELQKRLIPVFHYALNPGGFVFLGGSETIGDDPHMFSTIDRDARIYQRREVGHASGISTAWRAFAVSSDGSPRLKSTVKSEGLGSRGPLSGIAERALLQHMSAVAVLTDDAGDVLYVHGRTGMFLEPAPGESSLNVLQMAREGLRRELTTALRRAAVDGAPVHRTNVQVKSNGGFVHVNLTVRPVAVDADRKMFLIVFEESRSPPIPVSTGATGSAEEGTEVDARVKELLAELSAKEEYLQTTQEEMQTSNEELKSSNEELQSTNEELQSTNEELETSKEELQSVNEELATVNAELQTKVADLSRVNNDMNNLLAATGIGTIFVDHGLRIQRFTPAVTPLINLISSDVGRPVGHIVSNLKGYDRLVEDVQATLDTLIPSEVEVQTISGDWFLLRIRPYRTVENAIEGAVITFVAITEFKNLRSALRESEALNRLAVVVRDAHDAITVRDLKGGIIAWNPAAERLYGWTEAEAKEMGAFEQIPQEHRKAEAALSDARGPLSVEPRMAKRMTKDGEVLEVWVTTSPLVGVDGAVYAIATTETHRLSKAGAPNGAEGGSA